jgi:hypothetical protein
MPDAARRLYVQALVAVPVPGCEDFILVRQSI